MRVKQVLRLPIRDIDGEDYRFYVPSDTLGQEPWLIDLIEHMGRGHCECPDQRCVKDVNRKNGERDIYKITCKHIRRAMLHWALKELRKRAHEEREREKALKHGTKATT